MTDQTIDLVEYLQVIEKRKKSIIFITVSAFVISAVVTLLLPKVYSSTAKILPPQQDQGIMSAFMGQMGVGVASLASDILGAGKPSDLYAGILDSDGLRDKIIDRFKLMDVYGERYRLDTYKVMQEKVTIVSGKKDGIISITVEDKDPKRAADMANAFVQELGKMTVVMSISGASQKRSFIEERLSKAKVDLARAEDGLKIFQAKNKALDLPEQAKGTIKGIADLMGELAVQEVQLATLRRQFTDDSQEVKNLKASISNMKTQLAKLEGGGTRSAIPSVGSMPAMGQEYLRLMREFKIQETLVELLTKQYEMVKFTEANEVSNIQVIQKATVPDKRIKPKRTIVVAASSVGGFLFAVLFAFFAEFLDRLHPEKRALLQQTVRRFFSLRETV